MLNSSFSYLQEMIERLLRATNREHVEMLLDIMRRNGYFQTGCSGHHQWEGGLAQYSIEVLLRMQRQNDTEIPVDSIIIAALLHGLWMVNGFDHYYNHGSRSVLIADEIGFPLHSYEYQAILWQRHGLKEKGKLGSSFDAVLNNSLWRLLRNASIYSQRHPMTMEELYNAMSDKPHRIINNETSVRILAHGCDASLKRAPKNELDSPKTELSLEEKRRRAIRQSHASMADVFNSLERRGVHVPETVQRDMIDEFESSRSINNMGFDAVYRMSASPKDIERHRTILMDRCHYSRNTANMVAMYLYKETTGVFDWRLETNVMYQWLMDEFQINATIHAFYKARPKYDSYRN